MIGYLDDFLIVPAGIGLAIKLIPGVVLAEHREAAARRFTAGRPGSWTGAVIVLTIWLAALVWLAWVLSPILRD